MRLFLLGALALAFCFGSVAVSQDEVSPPMIPEMGEIAASNPDFETVMRESLDRRLQAATRNSVAVFDVRATLLTKSDSWGYVWRAEVILKIENAESRSIHVYWLNRDDGTLRTSRFSNVPATLRF